MESKKLKRHEEPVWWFPFDSMSSGDSFFIPTLKSSHMIYAVEAEAKRAQVKVKAYSVVEDGYMGVRVWRIR